MDGCEVLTACRTGGAGLELGWFHWLLVILLVMLCIQFGTMLVLSLCREDNPKEGAYDPANQDVFP